MTANLLTPGQDGGYPPGRVPLLSPVAMLERADAQHHAPADGAPGDPARPPRRRAEAARSGLAGAALLAALAAAGAAAVLLTVPRAAELAHLTHRDRSVLIPAGALAGVIAAVLAWRLVRRLASGYRTADRLTFLAASTASAVAATGMWRVFGVILHFDIVLRVLLFPFIELAVITSAVRARDNMRAALDRRQSTDDPPPRGFDIDGIAMWALTGLSAILSSMAAESLPEAIFRLAVPLVAAWLWERSLVSERRRTTGQRINWRITPEQILIRLGWADPTGREIGEVAAQRRVMQLALAAVDSASRNAQRAAGWRRRRADRRLRGALRSAIEHAALAEDPDRQSELVQQIAILRSYRDLAAMQPEPPWQALIPGPRPGGEPGPDRAAAGVTPEQLAAATAAVRAEVLAAFQELRAAVTAPPHADLNGGDGPLNGSGPQPEPPGPPAGDFAALAEALTVAQRQADGPRIHDLLAGRADYAGLARWVGAQQMLGGKRLLALIALYATRQTGSPKAVLDWIAAQVTGPAARVDKAEIRHVRDIIGPVWAALGYTPVHAGTEAS